MCLASCQPSWRRWVPSPRAPLRVRSPCRRCSRRTRHSGVTPSRPTCAPSSRLRARRPPAKVASRLATHTHSLSPLLCARGLPHRCVGGKGAMDDLTVLIPVRTRVARVRSVGPPWEAARSGLGVFGDLGRVEDSLFAANCWVSRQTSVALRLPRAAGSIPPIGDPDLRPPSSPSPEPSATPPVDAPGPSAAYSAPSPIESPTPLPAVVETYNTPLPVVPVAEPPLARIAQRVDTFCRLRDEVAMTTPTPL